MNPVENVWQFLRANWLAISVFDDYPAIVDACCLAWNRFADDPKTVTSITDRQWAQVNLQGRWYDITGYGLHVLWSGFERTFNFLRALRCRPFA